MASTILVLLSRRETTSWLLSAAECLATLIGGADIRALIVRPPPSRPPLLSVEIPMRQTAPATEAEERQRCASLRSAFTGWLHARPALDLSIQLDEVEALIDSAVIERGRQADIIVLEQPRQDGDVPQRVALQRTLLEAGRPVLVMPRRPYTVFGRRIAILWRDNAAARRALLAAISWLAQAETVDVIVGIQHGKSLATLPTILADQTLAVRLHRIPVLAGSLASELLAKVNELDCDLIVMGAYGHSAFRELFAGSVTENVLAQANRPILFCH